MSLTERRELTVGRCHSSGVSERNSATRWRLTSGNRSATRIGGIVVIGGSVAWTQERATMTGPVGDPRGSAPATVTPEG